MADESTTTEPDEQVLRPPVTPGVVVAKDTREMVTTILDSMAAIVQGDPGVVGGRDIVLADAFVDVPPQATEDLSLEGDQALDTRQAQAGRAAARSGQVGGRDIDAVAQAAFQAGFRGEELVTAVAIAAGESGFNPQAHNPNAKTGDNSYGLWQINMLGDMGPSRRKQFGIESNEALFDPVTNAKAAFALSGGGKNFKPWTVFTKGKHKQYLDEARAAVDRLGQNALEALRTEAR